MEKIRASNLSNGASTGVRISVVIPTLNEENSIALVLRDLPKDLHEVIVVDNGSTDRTAAIALAQGVRVIHEPRRGYGSACLAGLAALDDPDIVVFLDGDFSDFPEELANLVLPIVNGQADFVIGSRSRGIHERGALTLTQRFGNGLACLLMNLFWRTAYSDLGPFRAIRYSTLNRLGMCDRGFGWTIQMQIRAAKARMRIAEVPVRYRKRVGASKISGTLKGVVGAGTKILYTIFREAFTKSPIFKKGHAERLIVFTRYPEPGQAKTRLMPALGAEGAAACQRGMTAHALALAGRLAHERGVSVEVRFTGGDESRMREQFGSWHFKVQGPGDLGARLKSAAGNAFARGLDRIVIIGADCPALSQRTLQDAFDALASNDVVLGPSADGGYYLIGLRRMEPALFNGISWGGAGVFEETQALAQGLGMRAHLLETLRDVDLPDDLGLRNKDHRPGTPWLSIVIPARDEASVLPRTLSGLPTSEALEVIVVDGQSRDETAAVASRFGCQVIQCPAGRARQMNAGAAVARGKALLFLHADTQLPNGFMESIRQALAKPGTAAGAFRLAINSASIEYRLVEGLVNLRSRIRQRPYGDQALFVASDLFRQLGGYRELQVMEDFEFVLRLRRHGHIAVLRDSVLTSARRWEMCGVLKTTWINQLSILGYRLGMDAARLAAWRNSRLGLAETGASCAASPPRPTEEIPARIQTNTST